MTETEDAQTEAFYGLTKAQIGFNKMLNAIGRVRALGDEECDCLNYTSSCEHDGIARAIKALEGEDYGV